MKASFADVESTAKRHPLVGELFQHLAEERGVISVTAEGLSAIRAGLDAIRSDGERLATIHALFAVAAIIYNDPRAVGAALQIIHVAAAAHPTAAVGSISEAEDVIRRAQKAGFYGLSLHVNPADEKPRPDALTIRKLTPPRRITRG